jgi:hypothetical protein
MFQFGDGFREPASGKHAVAATVEQHLLYGCQIGCAEARQRAVTAAQASRLTVSIRRRSTPRLGSNQTDDDRAAARLRTKWRHVVDVVTEPTLAPKPWSDYFLGDTVSVRVVRDSLDLLTNPRVNQIVVNTDEQNREISHAISFEVI